MRYYIADLHFNHGNMNKNMDKRGFESAEAMNEYMIKQWNSKVKTGDEVVVLGDFCFGSGEVANKILARLRGKKYLIVGNHDRFLKDKEFEPERFKWIEHYKELNDDNRKVILSHYPIFCYNGQYRKDVGDNPLVYMLYGHVHNTFDEYLLNDFIQRTRDYKRFERDKEYHNIPCNMINCFCQFSDYVPLSLDEWIALDKNRRRNMDIEDMIKTGQALDIDVSFGDGFMKVSLPTEKYYRLKDAFAEHGLTIEEGLKRFVEWSVKKPVEFKAWVEECKKEGYFSEMELKAWT